MYLGIDIGGTKTLLASFEADGRLVEQVQFPTPQDYQAFISELANNIPKLNQHDFTAAAVGIPGLLDRSKGVVRLLSNLPWKDKPIRDDISRLTNCQVFIENDSKLGALSEAQVVINQYQRVLYLTLGTGISGGLVVQGKLDPHLLDAEFGQMVFPEDGQIKRWEAFSSGKAILDKYGQKASDIDDLKVWEAIGEELGLGVVSACAVTQPQAVIFGGGVGAYFDKFKPSLQAFIDSNLASIVTKPILLPAHHAEQAVVYGCYELAKQSNG